MPGIYICEQNPTLRIKIRGKKMHFDNKKLELEDPKDVAFLDKVIAEKPHVGMLIKKLDIAAAEEIARAHRERIAKQQAAFKGTATSVMENVKIQEIKDEFLARIDESDPAVRAAMDEIIRADPNASELELADLERIATEQKEKIEAARAEAAAKADNPEKQTDNGTNALAAILQKNGE